jgi:phosphosulfolactate synthase
MNGALDLPGRKNKPRDVGWTLVLDGGVPTKYFIDALDSYSQYIDFIKFGWCTSLLTKDLEKKINCALSHDIKIFFGGTFFEKALMQGKLDRFYQYLKQWNCQFMEISNGTINLDQKEKVKHIKDFSQEFKVLSEVGYKDSQRSLELYPAQWIECMTQDLEAGAVKVIAEARESGHSGICRADGEIRYGLISEIIDSSLSMDDVIFEAPTKTLQVYFTRRLGSDVNLGNITINDVLSLETLRLGLRADTLMVFEKEVGG